MKVLSLNRTRPKTQKLTGRSQGHVDIQLHNSQGSMRITPVSEKVFRIQARADNRFTDPSLVRYGILNLNLGRIKFSVKQNDKFSEVLTSEASLRVEYNGKVQLISKSGVELTRNAIPPVYQNGVDVRFELNGKEKLYGLGDVNRERIEKRGFRTAIWVQNVKSYVPIPFLMSDRGWALFNNSTWKQFFDVGYSDRSKLRFWSRHGDLDYFLMAGESMPDLLESYTAIVGRPKLLPMWAYGLTFVCNQQANAREMLDDALNLRREGIPCDVIGLEPGWMSKHYDYSTEKTWHPERFYIPPWIRKSTDDCRPNQASFMGAAQRLGYKVSLWLCCDYDLSFEEERLAGNASAGTLQKIEGRHEDDFEQDQNFGHGPMRMDLITKPEEPWFEHLKKFVHDGASAFKMDGALQVNEHPDRKWGNGMSDEEMHNLYPTLLNKQMIHGFEKTAQRRAMVYSSGGFAGIQQYSATWAGDTGGGPKPLVSMVNLGMSGHSNSSCDMDVFSPAGLHFGFLQPWSQICSWAYWRHPWLLGDKLLPILKFYARLRYQLLPYLYSMAHIAHTTGLPILRGMPLAYPNDPKSDKLIHQYMLGDAFLVTAFENHVHLPEGQWFDYWTGTEFTGPTDIKYNIPSDRGGALFVRAGAIIPKYDVMDYVGQKSTERVKLEIYPQKGQSNTFKLYEDDGVSFEYSKGKVAMTQITCTESKRKVQIEIAARQGTYAEMPESRQFEIQLHNPKAPNKVLIQAKAIKDFQFEADTQKITIYASEDADRKQSVKIELHF